MNRDKRHQQHDINRGTVHVFVKKPLVNYDSADDYSEEDDQNDQQNLQNLNQCAESKHLAEQNTNDTHKIIPFFNWNHYNCNFEVETCPKVLARRTKQIHYGKALLCYQEYRRMVDKSGRIEGEPKTPNKYRRYSRRAFDGLIKKWKRHLHLYYNQMVQRHHMASFFNQLRFSQPEHL